jgi:phosphoglucosamine mutase
MAGLFGTSGIRGVYGKNITPSLAMHVGSALGAGSKKAVLARDARNTSPLLMRSLASGAMNSGSDVIDAGFAPTPVLAYATFVEKCSGAMITASHNPPEYNGIKLFSHGMEFTREQEGTVEKAMATPAQPASWEKAGQISLRDYSKEYIAFLLKKVDAAAIRKRRPRVLADCGNAAASKVAPALLRAAGCEVVELFCSDPGKFSRNLEPKQETLSEASKLVAEEKCDFGVAFDGDGDRAIGIDEMGRVMALDVQLAVFCSHFLALAGKKAGGARIVSTVESSLCVKETVASFGAKLSITPVGSLHVSQETQEQKAIFGGEPCGEYVFQDSVPCADGLRSALVLAEIFCSRGKLSALADAVHTYPIERRKYGCGEQGKGKAMALLKNSLAAEFRDATLSTIDGLRFDFQDGWLLVRPSGTEPAMRMTCEFREKKRLDWAVDRAEGAILKAIN